MLRSLILLLVVLGHAFCVGFGPPQLVARDFDDTPLWPEQVRQLGRLTRPELGATAALLVDLATQTVLYQKDAGKRLPPASTTKMMTALVALSRGNLADTVVVQPEDLAVDSAVELSAGEPWTLEDLLFALLLSSDNASALVIARHIAGSEAAFVDLMNAQAAEWGLKDTHFVNPHGHDAPGHHSTAVDLAQIARHGLAQPDFARLVSTPQRQVGRRTLRNRNELLGTYRGAEGVKTGTTDAAGQCLVSAAGRPDGRALCVVLGSADRYGDSRLLLDYYFANYRSVPLQLGPKGLNHIPWLDGSTAVLALQEEAWIVLPRWQLPWLRVQRLGQAPLAGESESPVARARFVVGSTVLAELPLVALAP